MLRWFEHAQIYHPRKEWEAAPSDLGRPCQDFFLTTSDGVKISAWFFPADESSPRRHMAVLVCHGNGGNISHRLGLTRGLLRSGVAVLLFDYRGYGRSGGELSEEGTYLDAQAAHIWLRAQGFTRIIAFGESLGGGIASELALREPLAGLILQSTFTSIPDIGAELLPWFPVRWLNTIKYDTLVKLPRIKIPLLVIHSRSDRLVRFHHAEKNFAAANEPKFFLETRGDHNESLSADEGQCAEAFEKLLKLIETTNPSARVVI